MEILFDFGDNIFQPERDGLLENAFEKLRYIQVRGQFASGQYA